MTTGPPLYLVSACGSAEEFVAAFRRYADRTGLFVPSSSPLPAGKRGRLALTLKDGGVMIEGEAEILQSSSRPTVLHGRPGMTVKFVEPDELSRIVIGELEKARLSMRPAPPSVPPRPAQVPAEPRPVPPTPSGRIDAANALAECVVIGDVTTLTDTASAPRSVGVAAPGKFAVPSIPAVGDRAKTPSTAPSPGAAQSTANRTLEASRPIDAEKPVAANAANNAADAKTPMLDRSRMTSVGLPVVDKLPAASGAIASKSPLGRAPLAKADPALADTKTAPQAPLNITAPSAAPPLVTTPPPKATDATIEAPPLDPSLVMDDEMTSFGEIPTKKPTPPSMNAVAPAGAGNPASAAVVAARATPASAAAPTATPASAAAPTATPASAAAPTAAPARAAAPMATPASVAAPTATPASAAAPTATPASAAAPTTAAASAAASTAAPASAAAPTAAPASGSPESARRSESSKNHKPTSIGFPITRGPAFETQARGIAVVPRPPGDAADPLPPTLPPKDPRTPPPTPRGKTPTTPPLTPRHPTPVAPVPIVRPPAKSAPVIADEEITDLGSGLTVLPEPSVVTETGERIKPATQRSGGMRASEILAAIPAGDWTMSPDESIPHALPPELKVPTPPTTDVAAPADTATTDAVHESTPAPAPPPGPQTDNWTMSLDPETHSWRAPEKLAKPTATPTSGNRVIALSSERPIEVVSWDEKPTGIGESKIEIDSELMAAASAAASASPPPTTASKLALDPTAPQTAIAAVHAMPPPLARGPSRAVAPGSSHALSYPAVDAREYPVTSVHAAPAAKSKKMVVLAIAAGAVAIGAIVVLLLTLRGRDKAPSSASTGSRESSAIAIGTTADAAEPGSQEPAGRDAQTAAAKEPETSKQPGATEPADVTTPPDAKDEAKDDVKDDAQGGEPTGEQIVEQPTAPVETPKAPEPKAPTAAGTCKVALTSVPKGADVYIGRQKVATTPGNLELPCGVETKISLRRSKFANTAKSFTPVAGQPNKFVFRLKRDLFLVKVTSTPAGATITTGGKSVGVTPTTIKLPAYDASVLTLTKPGYSAERSRFAPRQNNASHHVTLKKGR